MNGDATKTGRMQVLLLGNYIHDYQESMQRFLCMLSDGLPDRKIMVESIQPRPLVGALKPSATGVGKWLGYIDKFLLFPFALRRRVALLRRRGPVLVHICDHSNGPYCRYLQDVPHLVTCHDVLALRSARGDFPENRTGFTGRLYQRMILAGLKLAQYVVCDSEATREQFVDLTHLAPEQVSVIDVGLNYPYHPQRTEDARSRVDTLLQRIGLGGWLGGPFLLHVGGNQWYKNRRGLLKMYALLRQRSISVPPLFLVGEPLPGELRKTLVPAVSEHVIDIGKVENEDLQALYSAAEFLIFPSHYEGFGWPVAEAQASGCRVVTSNRAPMTEVGGAAAAYVDSSNPESAVEVIHELLLESMEQRAARIAAGLRNVERFNTAVMIDRYVDLYRRILSSSAL